MKAFETWFGSRTTAMILMIIGSLGISFGGLVVRSIDAAGPAQINLYRSLALIATTAFILALKHRGRTVVQMQRIGARGLIGGIVLGIGGITFMQALVYTSVANTVFTTSATPFIAAGIAFVFLNERLAGTTVLAMVVSLIGVAIMMADGFGTGSMFGNMMAFATAVAYATFAVILRKDRHLEMLPTIIVAGVIITIVSLVQTRGDYSISIHDLLLCILWGGVLSTGGNWVLVYASKILAAAELTLFVLLEVALAPLWVWIFVNETPSRMVLIGGVLVIAAVLMHTFLDARERAFS